MSLEGLLYQGTLAYSAEVKYLIECGVLRPPHELVTQPPHLDQGSCKRRIPDIHY